MLPWAVGIILCPHIGCDTKTEPPGDKLPAPLLYLLRSIYVSISSDLSWNPLYVLYSDAGNQMDMHKLISSVGLWICSGLLCETVRATYVDGMIKAYSLKHSMEQENPWPLAVPCSKNSKAIGGHWDACPTGVCS